MRRYDGSVIVILLSLSLFCLTLSQIHSQMSADEIYVGCNEQGLNKSFILVLVALPPCDDTSTSAIYEQI